MQDDAKTVQALVDEICRLRALLTPDQAVFELLDGAGICVEFAEGPREDALRQLHQRAIATQEFGPLFAVEVLRVPIYLTLDKGEGPLGV